MKKVTLLSFVFILLTLSSEVVYADESFTIDEVKINAVIDEQSVMHVEEQFTYTFTGDFEGMTREINSDVREFKAYVRENSNLTPLKVEKEDDTFKVYSASENETKSVVYEYEVHGSIDKYQDVADMTYAFFDSSNETDLHNVEIIIETPNDTITDETKFFLREDGQGTITVTDHHLHYSNPLLEAGNESFLRVIFPAGELANNVERKKDKEMLPTILEAEAEYASRKANLQSKTENLVPILIVLVGLAILLGIVIFIKHPARYRGERGEDSLLRMFENTDPLFVKYLDGYQLDFKAHLTYDSFISALISLKRRGVVTLEEVSSKRNEGGKTIRFNWLGTTNQEIDLADEYLYSWLFTEKDEEGNYFLLETITQNENESDKKNKEKAEEFQKSFTVWSGLVLSRDDYNHLRKEFQMYPWISILLTVVSFSLFYYFTTFDPISETEQIVLPIVFGSLALISIVTSKWKWISSFYLIIILIAHLIGFTFTSATILSVLFYIIAFSIVVGTPAYYFKDDVKQLKFAIKQAKTLFKKNNYPVDANPVKTERRLEYAVILGQGQKYGTEVAKIEFTENITKNLPLLYYPDLSTSILMYHNIVLVTDSAGTSSSSSTSSTGGGGAGAF